MTIQVNTLKINASVSASEQVKKIDSAAGNAPASNGAAANNEQLIELCVERVLDVLRRELKP